MTEMSGGCQCGRIRFRARIESSDAYLCHCRMCQRAVGNVSIAFVNLPQAAVTWEQEPDWYESSPIAKRPFCSKCGTPLGFRYNDSDKCDLHVGASKSPAISFPSSISAWRRCTKPGSTRRICPATGSRTTRPRSNAG